PGALRPPGPQTGKVPAPGTVSSFLLRKNLKTGVIIYQFIGPVVPLPHRHIAGRVAMSPEVTCVRHGSGGI
ncbi:hypothetical protein, partial [Victivallis vadensis]|uniref:hypothetical protein n=1 Tax=Victivallis vadensis TaxID=172901 RepID=UPI0023F527F8